MPDDLEYRLAVARTRARAAGSDVAQAEAAERHTFDIEQRQLAMDASEIIRGNTERSRVKTGQTVAPAIKMREAEALAPSGVLAADTVGATQTGQGRSVGGGFGAAFTDPGISAYRALPGLAKVANTVWPGEAVDFTQADIDRASQEQQIAAEAERGVGATAGRILGMGTQLAPALLSAPVSASAASASALARGLPMAAVRAAGNPTLLSATAPSALRIGAQLPLAIPMATGAAERVAGADADGVYEQGELLQKQLQAAALGSGNMAAMIGGTQMGAKLMQSLTRKMAPKSAGLLRSHAAEVAQAPAQAIGMTALQIPVEGAFAPEAGAVEELIDPGNVAENVGMFAAGQLLGPGMMRYRGNLAAQRHAAARRADPGRAERIQDFGLDRQLARNLGAQRDVAQVSTELNAPDRGIRQTLLADRQGKQTDWAAREAVAADAARESAVREQAGELAPGEPLGERPVAPSTREAARIDVRRQLGLPDLTAGLAPEARPVVEPLSPVDQRIIAGSQQPDAPADVGVTAGWTPREVATDWEIANAQARPTIGQPRTRQRMPESAMAPPARVNPDRDIRVRMDRAVEKIATTSTTANLAPRVRAAAKQLKLTPEGERNLMQQTVARWREVRTAAKPAAVAPVVKPAEPPPRESPPPVDTTVYSTRHGLTPEGRKAMGTPEAASGRTGEEPAKSTRRAPGEDAEDGFEPTRPDFEGRRAEIDAKLARGDITEEQAAGQRAAVDRAEGDYREAHAKWRSAKAKSDIAASKTAETGLKAGKVKTQADLDSDLAATREKVAKAGAKGAEAREIEEAETAAAETHRAAKAAEALAEERLRAAQGEGDPKAIREAGLVALEAKATADEATALAKKMKVNTEAAKGHATTVMSEKQRAEKRAIYTPLVSMLRASVKKYFAPDVEGRSTVEVTDEGVEISVPGMPKVATIKSVKDRLFDAGNEDQRLAVARSVLKNDISKRWAKMFPGEPVPASAEALAEHILFDKFIRKGGYEPIAITMRDGSQIILNQAAFERAVGEGKGVDVLAEEINHAIIRGLEKAEPEQFAALAKAAKEAGFGADVEGIWALYQKEYATLGEQRAEFAEKAVAQAVRASKVMESERGIFAGIRNIGRTIADTIVRMFKGREAVERRVAAREAAVNERIGEPPSLPTFVPIFENIYAGKGDAPVKGETVGDVTAKGTIETDAGSGFVGDYSTSGESIAANRKKLEQYLKANNITGKRRQLALDAQEIAETIRNGLTAEQRAFMDAVPESGSPIRTNLDKKYLWTFDAVTTCVRDYGLQPFYDKLLKASNKAGIDINSHMHAVAAILRSKGYIVPCIVCYKHNAQMNAAGGVQKLMQGWDTFKTDSANENESMAAKFRDAGVPASALDPFAKMRVEDKPQQAKYADVEVDGVKFGAWAVGRLGINSKQAVGFSSYDGDLLKQNGKTQIWPTLDGGEKLTFPEFVKKINPFGGFRMQSNSDFQMEHAIDDYQFLSHVGLLGGTAHTYTNVPAMAQLFAAAGLKINTSLHAMTMPNGRVVPMSYEGRNAQGMNWEQAFKLREKFPDVGSVLIATDLAQIKFALNSPKIDYLLVNHRSAQHREMTKAFNIKDYGYGEETFLPGRSAKDVPAKYQDMLFTVPATGEVKIRIPMGSYTNFKSGDNLASMKRKYLALCKELGVHPRFDPAMTKGVGDRAGWKEIFDHPNYMKAVVDLARWDTPLRPIDVSKVDTRRLNAMVIAGMKNVERDGAKPIPDSAVKEALAQVQKYSKLGADETLKRVHDDVITDAGLAIGEGKVKAYDPETAKDMEGDYATRRTVEVDGTERPLEDSTGKPIHATEEGVKNFWRWFGNSKLVDDQGRPRSMYHGTPRDFDTFKVSPRGLYGKGIYFTESKRYASDFYAADNEGGRVIPIYAKMENPWVVADRGKPPENVSELGYDGVIADARTVKAGGAKGQEITEGAVFDPTQVKSALGNRGTFDPAEARVDYATRRGEDDDTEDVTPRSAELANPGREPFARALFRAVMEMRPQPERQISEDALKEARRIITGKGGIRAVERKMERGEILSRPETIVARHLLNAATQDFAGAKGTKDADEALKYANKRAFEYADTGTAWGRSGVARKDYWKRPADRIAEIGDWFLRPGESLVRARRRALEAGDKELAESFTEANHEIAKRAIRRFKKIYGENLVDFATALSDRDAAVEVANVAAMLKADAIREVAAENRKTLNAKIYGAMVAANQINAEAVRSALLSGPTTHIKNALSNTANLAYKVTQKSIEMAATGDKGALKHALTVSVLKHAIIEGSQNFMRSFRAGHDTMEQKVFGEQATHYDMTPEEQAKRAHLPKLLRAPLTLMGAADSFFKTIYARTTVVMEAYREIHAQKPNATEAEIKDYIATQVGDHTSEAWQKAYTEAAEVTFQELSSAYHDARGGSTAAIAKGLAKIQQIPLAGPLMLPFIMTPLAILRQSMLRSPVGAFRMGLRYMENQRNLSGNERARKYTKQEVLRDTIDSFLGTALMSLAYGAVASLRDENDEPIVTGAAADFKTERGKRDAEMNKEIAPPMSIKVGNRWVSYATIEPFSTLLQSAVDAGRLADKKLPWDKALVKSTASAVRTIANKSALTSLGDVYRVITGENEASWANYAAGRATSYVPRLFMQPYNTMFAENEEIPVRPGNPDRKLAAGEEEGPVEQTTRLARDRIPGATGAKPRVDLGGEEVPRFTGPDSTIGRVLAGMGMPAVTPKRDAWRTFIVRYNEQLPGDGKEWWPLGWDSDTEVDGKKLRMTQEERYEMHTKYGKIFAEAAGKLITVDDIDKATGAVAERKIEALKTLRSKVGSRMLLDFRRRRAAR
jgi:hypothetical protein